MTESQKVALLKERINKLENRPHNVKCPGVLKKLHRQLRNAE
jgi:hypothetical protein